MATRFGAEIVFVTPKGGTRMAAARVQVNGKTVIVLSTEAIDSPAALVLHEIVHDMPDHIRRPLLDAVMATVTPEKRIKFLENFKGYQGLSDSKQNEEITAMLAQEEARRPEFWRKLGEKMPEGKFRELAQYVLGKVDELTALFGGVKVRQYTNNIKAVREALTSAYAQLASERGGKPLDGAKSAAVEQEAEPQFSERGRLEQHGAHEVRVFKDGSIRVDGDSAAIRALMPENITGRMTDKGMVFANADAPRARAALDGRAVAYSRGGEVTDKLPMKNGRYLGAPKKYDKPGNIAMLRKSLMRLTLEGKDGRFWYENSGKAIMRMTGGDVNEARKFVALCAIYSPQAKVDTNSTFALRAWAQYKAGHPISVKTDVMDEKAQGALDSVDEFWSGEKTGNFFFNLLRMIDPSTEGKQGATIDMWMMRAAEYSNDAPTKTQYAFMENETNRIAAELGWEPQQVQAAVWVAMKARMENRGVKKATEAKSEKRGWIHYEYPLKDGKPTKTRVIDSEQKHRDNWLAHAFAHDPTTDDTKAAKFDFENGVQAHIGLVSWEARPSRSVATMQGVNSAPWEQQVEYQQAILRALQGDNGADLLAQRLGLLVDGPDLLAPGAWQGEVSAGMQKSVPMSPVAGGTRLIDTANGAEISEEAAAAIDKGWKKSDRFRDLPRVDDGQADTLNVYAAALGLLLKQDGVGWHRPFYSSAKKDANGREWRIGRPLTQDEMAAAYAAIDTKMRADGKPDWQDGMALVSSPVGLRVISFGTLTNAELQSNEFRDVVGDAIPDSVNGSFASHGDMPTNNWKESPDGQEYRSRIATPGRPDLLGWVRDFLAPRVQSVNEEFSKRYGWGDPGSIDFSESAEPDSGRPEPARDRRGRVQGGSLAPLEGAPNVSGATGPDERLVRVADEYARANGLTVGRQRAYVDVDPARATRTAKAYADMRHAPGDPRVREAYKNLIKQTTAQYRMLEQCSARARG